MNLVSGGRTITVIGASSASDELTIGQAEIVVESLQPTVQDASRQVDERMASVMQVLQNHGADPADIHQSSHTIAREGSATTGGYRVSKVLRVTIRNIDQVATTLDSVVEAGANPFFNVTFSRAELGDSNAEAWVDVLQVARERAKSQRRLTSI